MDSNCNALQNVSGIKRQKNGSHHKHIFFYSWGVRLTLMSGEAL
jgi:hypothetical protein